MLLIHLPERMTDKNMASPHATMTTTLMGGGGGGGLAITFLSDSIGKTDILLHVQCTIDSVQSYTKYVQ